MSTPVDLYLGMLEMLKTEKIYEYDHKVQMSSIVSDFYNFKKKFDSAQMIEEMIIQDDGSPLFFMHKYLDFDCKSFTINVTKSNIIITSFASNDSFDFYLFCSLLSLFRKITNFYIPVEKDELNKVKQQNLSTLEIEMKNMKVECIEIKVDSYPCIFDINKDELKQKYKTPLCKESICNDFGCKIQRPSKNIRKKDKVISMTMFYKTAGYVPALFIALEWWSEIGYQLYPDWTIRVYIENRIYYNPPEVVKEYDGQNIIDQIIHKGNIEIIFWECPWGLNEDKVSHRDTFGSIIRLHALIDGFNCVICKNLESMSSTREKRIIDTWIRSGKVFLINQFVQEQTNYICSKDSRSDICRRFEKQISSSPMPILNLFGYQSKTPLITNFEEILKMAFKSGFNYVYGVDEAYLMNICNNSDLWKPENLHIISFIDPIVEDENKGFQSKIQIKNRWFTKKFLSLHIDEVCVTPLEVLHDLEMTSINLLQNYAIDKVDEIFEEFLNKLKHQFSLFFNYCGDYLGFGIFAMIHSIKALTLVSPKNSYLGTAQLVLEDQITDLLTEDIKKQINIASQNLTIISTVDWNISADLKNRKLQDYGIDKKTYNSFLNQVIDLTALELQYSDTFIHPTYIHQKTKYILRNNNITRFYEDSEHENGQIQGYKISTQQLIPYLFLYNEFFLDYLRFNTDDIKFEEEYNKRLIEETEYKNIELRRKEIENKKKEEIQKDNDFYTEKLEKENLIYIFGDVYKLSVNSLPSCENVLQIRDDNQIQKYYSIVEINGKKRSDLTNYGLFNGIVKMISKTIYHDYYTTSEKHLIKNSVLGISPTSCYLTVCIKENDYRKVHDIYYKDEKYYFVTNRRTIAVPITKFATDM